MTAEMARARAFRTSSEHVDLAVSIGVHSGVVDLYLLGQLHRELVVTGPEASVTSRMESVADAGEVVISAATAARIPAAAVGVAKGDGFLLAGVPEVAWVAGEPGRPRGRRGLTGLIRHAGQPGRWRRES